MSEEYSIADSKQTDFGFGVDDQAEDPLRPDSPCPVRSLRMTLSWVGSLVLAPGIRPFRYDLNQIPFDYTVEVRN